MINFYDWGCKDMNDEQNLTEIDAQKLPDTVALQDDFTREFIASPEEVEEGYYLFESKTGGYTMWYPKNAKLDQTFYKIMIKYLTFGQSLTHPYPISLSPP